jgi:hypothetical protein
MIELCRGGGLQCCCLVDWEGQDEAEIGDGVDVDRVANQ